jgi:hypothetical protein
MSAEHTNSWPVSNAQLTYLVSVVFVDIASDLILLEINQDLCRDNIEMSDPILGEK